MTQAPLTSRYSAGRGVPADGSVSLGRYGAIFFRCRVLCVGRFWKHLFEVKNGCISRDEESVNSEQGMTIGNLDGEEQALSLSPKAKNQTSATPE